MKRSESNSKNAVVYARFSSNAQTERSIDGQLADAREYAAREGYTIVHEYIDRALSGRYDDRPQFQQMIADSAKHTFSYVLVWKLDRFSRNRYDSAVYKHKLGQNGVKVLSVMESIGDNPESIILEAVLEASAEYYSIDLAKKIERGRKVAVSRGTYLGGGCALGFRVEDKRLVVDERSAAFVRLAFRMYADGARLTDIADRINSMGALTTHNHPFTVNSLHPILTNERYIGKYSFAGMAYAEPLPAIIDRELWDRVQARIAQRAHAPAANRNREEVDYLLSGKVYCNLCGDHMIGDQGTGRHGTVYHYYTCASHKHHSKTCPKRSERQQPLEDFVLTQTREWILAPDRLSAIADAVLAEYDREFDRSGIAAQEAVLAQISADLNEAINLSLRTKGAVQSAYMARAEQLAAERDAAETDLAKLRAAASVRFTKSDILAWLDTFRTLDLTDPANRHRLIDTFVNSVYVGDDLIVIYYNLKGSTSSGTKINGPDDLEAVDSEGSTSDDVSGHDRTKVEPKTFIAFVQGALALVCYR